MDELVCGNVMMSEQSIINEKEYYSESDETDYIKMMGFYTIIDDEYIEEKVKFFLRIFRMSNAEL